MQLKNFLKKYKVYQSKSKTQILSANIAKTIFNLLLIIYNQANFCHCRSLVCKQRCDRGAASRHPSERGVGGAGQLRIQRLRRALDGGPQSRGAAQGGRGADHRGGSVVGARHQRQWASQGGAAVAAGPWGALQGWPRRGAVQDPWGVQPQEGAHFQRVPSQRQCVGPPQARYSIILLFFVSYHIV